MNTLPLDHQDWKKINDIILDINCLNSIPDVADSLLLHLEKMIPYDKAAVIFYDNIDKGFNVNTFIHNGSNDSEKKMYCDYYYKLDDVVDKLLPFNKTTFRSSDMLNQNEREKTEYYCDYVVPAKTHFSLDSNLVWSINKKPCGFGTLDLFRSRKSMDFSDRELTICQILSDHLEIRASELGSNNTIIKPTFFEATTLTNRESEVLELLLAGCTNEFIASKLFISLSTVKKHVTSVLEKTHTSSRLELILKSNIQ